MSEEELGTKIALQYAEIQALKSEVQRAYKIIGDQAARETNQSEESRKTLRISALESRLQSFQEAARVLAEYAKASRYWRDDKFYKLTDPWVIADNAIDANPLAKALVQNAREI